MSAPKSLLFTENKNQWPDQVRFRADLHNGKFYLLPTGFLYQFYDGSSLQHPGHAGEEKNNAGKSNKVKAHAYSVTFLGANPEPGFTKTAGTPELRNYF
ncbi:MAG: hypothetical protein LPK19_03975 [Hymenobacteraceae bacterium]|nr:hypothetical protein [Hymenobacteraceae bacterium]MDX5395354.1 hypothetical protein [Hymenobacteraceae bacterium]MDX5511405.1 hypothetical protein [Hymenobacteraceae bacterium]